MICARRHLEIDSCSTSFFPAEGRGGRHRTFQAFLLQGVRLPWRGSDLKGCQPSDVCDLLECIRRVCDLSTGHRIAGPPRREALHIMRTTGCEDFGRKQGSMLLRERSVAPARCQTSVLPKSADLCPDRRP